MQANWSLILNVLLLLGVIVAMGRLMKARRKSLNPIRYQPNLGTSEKKYDTTSDFDDEIIEVRKIDALAANFEAQEDLHILKKTVEKSPQPRLMPQNNEDEIKFGPKSTPKIETETLPEKGKEAATLMIFLLAKENRQFAGYELLQTVLAAGLRFGDGHLFHRHQFPNGQGPVLCSLAAATASGVFDLHNMGAFSVHGLCLYMHSSKNSNIDIERFTVMLETAHQLSEGLDAHLLDDRRRPLTEEGIRRYQRRLQVQEVCLEPSF